MLFPKSRLLTKEENVIIGKLLFCRSKDQRVPKDAEVLATYAGPDGTGYYIFVAQFKMKADADPITLPIKIPRNYLDSLNSFLECGLNELECDQEETRHYMLFKEKEAGDKVLSSI